MTKIINFFGGPGAGKSTMALNVTGWMKVQRMNVEYASEFAKVLSWQNRKECLDDQLFIFGIQQHSLYSLLGKVDYVITDSPLLLSLYYGPSAQKLFDNENRNFWEESFYELVLNTYNFYDNINFVVERNDRKYVEAGRNQTETEAKGIDENINRILQHHKIPFKRVASLEDVLNNLGLT